MVDQTYSTEGPQCPYCGRQFTADDASYYQPSYTEDKCDECGKTFEVGVDTVTTWTCDPISETVEAS
jgi:DNA-directed RNA polymerase subunit RPC12/RpoP